MKLLRYLVNTILFVVIWCIPAFLFVGISLSVSGTRPSAIAGVGGIVAIIISYRLVKRINKSNLWSRLFDEAKEFKEDENSRVDKRINYSLLILGILLISTGLILMIGGGYENPNEFSYEAYNFRRLTLAPFLIVIGFIIEVLAFMYKSKK